MAGVPLHVVSGFLGAGKTTAIRAQLEARAGEQLAIIVNDFGEAALDEVAVGEIASAGAEPFRITNIPGACVCCTAPEGFVDALGAVLDGEPDRIVIEPTGLARPQDLLDTVRRSPHGARVELGPVVVLVDPSALPEGEPGGVLAEQLEAADVLVANRTDLASPGAMARFDALAASLWPAPLAVHRTTHGALPPEAFEWPDGEGARLPRGAGVGHAHGHDSTEGYAARSWHWAPDVAFSRERLGTALRAAAERGELARLKGIFRTLEGVYRVEVAGGRVHERTTSFRRDSRVDAIARGGEPELARIGDALAGAVLSDEEATLSPERIEVVLGDGRVHVIDRELVLAAPDPLADVSTLFPKREGSAARLRGVWEKLGLPDSGEVVIVAGDGFASEPVPVPILLEGFLLHSVGGEPLDASQGGPFRLLIPESANPPSGACANVKGVAKLVHRAS